MNTNHTWLNHRLLNTFNGHEWIDYGLPTPTEIVRQGNTIDVNYKLNGFFGTDRSKKYIDDMSVRFCKTFKSYKPNRIDRVDYDSRQSIILRNDNCHELADLQGLDSITTVSFDKDIDFAAKDKLFDAIRYTIYNYVNRNGLESLSLEFVTHIAETHNHQYNKDNSDVRAKSRAIFKWMLQNYHIPFKYSELTNEQQAEYMKKYRLNNNIHKNSQDVHLDNVAKQKKRKTLAKLKGAIVELQELGQKVNINRLELITGISRKTIRKYKKELGLEKKTKLDLVLDELRTGKELLFKNTVYVSVKNNNIFYFTKSGKYLNKKSYEILTQWIEQQNNFEYRNK